MRTTQIIEDIFEDSFNMIVSGSTPISFLSSPISFLSSPRIKLTTLEFIHLHIEIAKVLNIYVKTKDFQQCETIEDLAIFINYKIDSKYGIYNNQEK